MLCSIPERPDISQDGVIVLAKNCFGLDVLSVKELVSYDDRNIYLTTKSVNYVMKITNSKDSAHEDLLEAQNDAMLLLKKRGVKCNVPHQSLDKKFISYVSIDGKGTNAVRLLDFLQGTLLDKMSFNPVLLFNLGKYVGKLDSIFKEYTHPSLHDKTKVMWDLQQISEIEKYINSKYLGSQGRVDLILKVYNKYTSVVPFSLNDLSKQVIHNDLNQDNIIVSKDQTFAVIDFGDISYSYRVFEVSIVMADIILRQFVKGTDNHFDCPSDFLQGYQSVFPLSLQELELLYWCIGARFVQLLVIGSVKLFMDPKNTYVMDKEKHIWDLLPEYLAINDREMLQKWLQ